MACILAISSQVARGAIGLSAAVPALQALGHEVIALPTILLSNHPGHRHFAGEHVSSDLLRRMLDALAENGWLTGLGAVLTGYLPTAEHVAFATEAVERVRSASPSALHLCDPILGDEPKGLYVGRDAAEAIRDRLVPDADVLKMNRFECEWLTGGPITSSADVAFVASRNRWPATIVTSVPAAKSTDILNVLVEPGMAPMERRSVRHPNVPKGTGDLMAALWLGARLQPAGTTAAAFARAAAGIEHVVQRSLEADELQLVSCLSEVCA